jgi:hypothetical protein
MGAGRHILSNPPNAHTVKYASPIVSGHYSSLEIAHLTRHEAYGVKLMPCGPEPSLNLKDTAPRQALSRNWSQP